MKKLAVGVCTVAAVAALAIGTKKYLEGTGKKIAELEDRVAYMKEDCVPLRFEIVQKKNSEIQVKVSMYDVQTEKKVGRSGSFTLAGEELHVDSQVIKLSDENFIFFPCGLYTDAMALTDSEKLYPLYDENGFPSIYGGVIDALDDGSAVSQDDRVALGKELTGYFSLVKDGGESQSTEQYGTAIHELKSISQFKAGFVYELQCHPHTGGIEIRKAD